LLAVNPILRPLRRFHCSLIHPLLLVLAGYGSVCFLLNRLMRRARWGLRGIYSLCHIVTSSTRDGPAKPRGCPERSCYNRNTPPCARQPFPSSDDCKRLQSHPRFFSLPLFTPSAPPKQES